MVKTATAFSVTNLPRLFGTMSIQRRQRLLDACSILMRIKDMFLGNEISRVLSILFSSANAKQERSRGRRAQEECRLPLMQIVEKKVSQRQKVARTGLEQQSFTVASRLALASEVGPPPLTHVTWRN